MPHVDITMIPGRDDQAKKEIAEKVQNFLANELGIDTGFVSVSIEDIPKEKWQKHMENMKDRVKCVVLIQYIECIFCFDMIYSGVLD